MVPIEDFTPGTCGTRRQGVGRSQPALMSFRRAQMRRRREDAFRFQDAEQENVAVLSLRRRSHLFVFLAVICEFAVLDTVGVIPIGILVYAVSLSLAIEQMASVVPGDSNRQAAERLQDRDDFNRRYEQALFEYRILRRSKARIVPVEEDGVVRLYAV